MLGTASSWGSGPVPGMGRCLVALGTIHLVWSLDSRHMNEIKLSSVCLPYIEKLKKCPFLPLFQTNNLL